MSRELHYPELFCAIFKLAFSVAGPHHAIAARPALAAITLTELLSTRGVSDGFVLPPIRRIIAAR